MSARRGAGSRIITLVKDKVFIIIILSFLSLACRCEEERSDDEAISNKTAIVCQWESSVKEEIASPKDGSQRHTNSICCQSLGRLLYFLRADRFGQPILGFQFMAELLRVEPVIVPAKFQ
jgi:hypothetical protein